MFVAAGYATNKKSGSNSASLFQWGFCFMLESRYFVDFETHNRIKRKAAKVLSLLHNSNKNFIFPNVLEIEKALKSRNNST